VIHLARRIQSIKIIKKEGRAEGREAKTKNEN
jgi:hypothetical protein